MDGGENPRPRPWPSTFRYRCLKSARTPRPDKRGPPPADGAQRLRRPTPGPRVTPGSGNRVGSCAVPVPEELSGPTVWRRKEPVINGARRATRHIAAGPSAPGLADPPGPSRQRIVPRMASGSGSAKRGGVANPSLVAPTVSARVGVGVPALRDPGPTCSYAREGRAAGDIVQGCGEWRKTVGAKETELREKGPFAGKRPGSACPLSDREHLITRTGWGRAT